MHAHPAKPKRDLVGLKAFYEFKNLREEVIENGHMLSS